MRGTPFLICTIVFVSSLVAQLVGMTQLKVSKHLLPDYGKWTSLLHAPEQSCVSIGQGHTTRMGEFKCEPNFVLLISLRLRQISLILQYLDQYKSMVTQRLFQNNVLDLYACLMQLKLPLAIECNTRKSTNKEKYFLKYKFVYDNI